MQDQNFVNAQLVLATVAVTQLQFSFGTGPEAMVRVVTRTAHKTTLFETGLDPDGGSIVVVYSYQRHSN